MRPTSALKAAVGKAFRLAVVPGDGVGKEVIPQALRVLDVIQQHTPYVFQYVHLIAGWDAVKATSSPLPARTLIGIKNCDACLFGAVESKAMPGHRTPIVTVRQQLELYANIIQCVSAPVDISTIAPNLDLLIVRENTEDVYIMQEMLEETRQGKVGIAMRRITEYASTRIARFAFNQARLRRRKVTIVHKSNVMTVTDGLFRECCCWVGSNEFPDVEFNEHLLDSFIVKLCREPLQYDVILCPNMYGWMIGHAIASLVGGVGIVPCLNYNEDFVLAEPIHGTSRWMEGTGRANPTAAIRAVGMMLQSLIPDGTLTQCIECAVQDALVDHRVAMTPDLLGPCTTIQTTDHIIARLVPYLKALQDKNAAGPVCEIPSAGERAPSESPS
jgi:homoisocitrate dehydrogenase